MSALGCEQRKLADRLGRAQKRSPGTARCRGLAREIRIGRRKGRGRPAGYSNVAKCDPTGQPRTPNRQGSGRERCEGGQTWQEATNESKNEAKSRRLAPKNSSPGGLATISYWELFTSCSPQPVVGGQKRRHNIWVSRENASTGFCPRPTEICPFPAAPARPRPTHRESVPGKPRKSAPPKAKIARGGRTFRPSLGPRLPTPAVGDGGPASGYRKPDDDRAALPRRHTAGGPHTRAVAPEHTSLVLRDLAPREPPRPARDTGVFPGRPPATGRKKGGDPSVAARDSLHETGPAQRRFGAT